MNLGLEAACQRLREIAPDKLDFMIYIDFSLSNKYRQRKTHLHELHEANPYVLSLNALVSVIHSIFPGHPVDIYRFGCAESQHNNVVPLFNGVSTYRSGEEIIEAYESAITEVELSGPSQFSLCFEHSLDHARRRPGCFVVTFLLKNGASQSVRLDYNELIRANYFPVSYNIVNLGICARSPLERRGVQKVFPSVSYANFNALRRIFLGNRRLIERRLQRSVFSKLPDELEYYISNNYLSNDRNVEINDHEIVITLYGIEILRKELVFDGLLGDRDVM